MNPRGLSATRKRHRPHARGGEPVLARALEHPSLFLHGYRQLTNRKEAVLRGSMQAVPQRMSVSHRPDIRVLDGPVPTAWTFRRTIALTSQLVALDQRELARYRDRDAIALHLAWATAWPLVLCFNLWPALQGHQVVRESQVQVGPGGMMVGTAQRLTK